MSPCTCRLSSRITYAEALAEDITDDDIEEDRAERTIRLFSLTPAVGAVCQLVGAIVALTAVCTWKDSGAPDAAPIIELRLVFATFGENSWRLRTTRRAIGGGVMIVNPCHNIRPV